RARRGLGLPAAAAGAAPRDGGCRTWAVLARGLDDLLALPLRDAAPDVVGGQSDPDGAHPAGEEAELGHPAMLAALPLLLVASLRLAVAVAAAVVGRLLSRAGLGSRRRGRPVLVLRVVARGRRGRVGLGERASGFGSRLRVATMGTPRR